MPGSSRIALAGANPPVPLARSAVSVRGGLAGLSPAREGRCFIPDFLPAASKALLAARQPPPSPSPTVLLSNPSFQSTWRAEGGAGRSFPWLRSQCWVSPHLCCIAAGWGSFTEGRMGELVSAPRTEPPSPGVRRDEGRFAENCVRRRGRPRTFRGTKRSQRSGS